MKVKNIGKRDVAFNGILFAVGEEKEVENVKPSDLSPTLQVIEYKKKSKKEV